MPAATACVSSTLDFPGPAKLISRGVRARVEGDQQLGPRCDVESVDAPGKKADEGRHRVRLDRVVQADRPGQRGTQRPHPLVDQLAVVRVKRRAPDARGQQRQPHATHG
jgi:hypothetical protein